MLAVSNSIVVREVEHRLYKSLACIVRLLFFILILYFHVELDLLVLWVVDLEKIFFINYKERGIWAYEISNARVEAAFNQLSSHRILDILLNSFIARNSIKSHFFIRLWFFDLEENVKHIIVIV